jgi:ribose 5-phosphate isomerase B
MRFVVASDHAGFPLKARTIETLQALGHEVEDLGTNSTDPVDYPDYSRAVALAVLEGRAERGVLVCGSGAGACVAANKFRGIRAATCHDTFSAHQCVEDDDVNVLCLGGRIIGPEVATEVLRSFAGARFSNAERHLRRLNKVLGFEADFSK